MSTTPKVTLLPFIIAYCVVSSILLRSTDSLQARMRPQCIHGSPLNSFSLFAPSDEKSFLETVETGGDEALQYCSSSELYSDNETNLQRANERTHPRSSKTTATDVFIIVVESLSRHHLAKNMPLTLKCLSLLDTNWFPNLHHRTGTTRGNLPSLFFGSPTNLTYGPNQGEFHNGSAVFPLTKHELEVGAVWNIFRNQGYTTLFGSTACNILFGLNHASSKDGHVFHDSFTSRSDFDFMYPSGAFTHSCPWTGWHDAENIEEILQCSLAGPFHHKFLEYYKHFRGSIEGPIFTSIHLLESHGQKDWMFRAIDFHLSHFVHWLGDMKDTMIVFLGDHGDISGTPLGIVLPPKMKKGDVALKRLKDNLVLFDDMYLFLKDFAASQNIKKSARALQRHSDARRCSDVSDLAICFCKQTDEILQYNMTLQKKAVERIVSRSDAECTPFIVHNVTFTSTFLVLEMRIVFTNRSVFIARFSSADDFHIFQETKYKTQIPCTPTGRDPQFCVCDLERFEAANPDSLGIGEPGAGALAGRAGVSNASDTAAGGTASVSGSGAHEGQYLNSGERQTI